MTITLEEAMVRIGDKIRKDAEKLVRSFENSKIQLLKGRWGPYIHDPDTGLNAKIRKDEDPQTISLQTCIERLKEEGKAPAGRGRAAAKTPAKSKTPSEAAATPNKAPGKAAAKKTANPKTKASKK